MAKKENSRSPGFHKKPASKNKERTNHLLVIGIDEYSNGISPLQNAVRDASDFQNYLHKNFKFQKEHTHTLFNKEATRKNVLKTFDNFLLKLTDQDNLVFFFSGHGEFLETTNKGYWLTADAESDDRSTYLSNNEIYDLLSNIKAHHVFGIVDSCFSGALFDRGGKGKREKRVDAYPSRWLLTAGRKELVSDGSLGSNSPFTKTLLTVFKAFQNKGKTAFSVGRLCNEVLDLIEYTPSSQTPRGEPLSGVGHFGGEFVFVEQGATYSDPEPSTPPKDDPAPTRGNNPSETLPNQEGEITPFLLKEWIAEGNTEMVIDGLKEKLNPSSKKVNDLILLSGRFNRLKKNASLGILSSENENLERNKIHAAFLSLIDDLDEDDWKNSPTQAASGISDTSRKQLLEEKELLEEKLGFLRQQLATSYDALAKFSMTKEIEKTEKRMEEITQSLNN